MSTASTFSRASRASRSSRGSTDSTDSTIIPKLAELGAMAELGTLEEEEGLEGVEEGDEDVMGDSEEWEKLDRGEQIKDRGRLVLFILFFWKLEVLVFGCLYIMDFLLLPPPSSFLSSQLKMT